MTAPDEQALIDFLQRTGEWVTAECAPGDVERLRQMDHHVVTVRGRAGLLLTYHLWGDLPPATPPRIYVLFHHTAGHPRAPDDVQRAIERLLY